MGEIRMLKPIKEGVEGFFLCIIGMAEAKLSHVRALEQSILDHYEMYYNIS